MEESHFLVVMILAQSGIKSAFFATRTKENKPIPLSFHRGIVLDLI